MLYSLQLALADFTLAAPWLGLWFGTALGCFGVLGSGFRVLGFTGLGFRCLGCRVGVSIDNI